MSEGGPVESETALPEAIPAGIRREPVAKPGRQCMQRRRHVLRSAGAGIIQRAAAKRRISSAENHRPVETISGLSTMPSRRQATQTFDIGRISRSIISGVGCAVEGEPDALSALPSFQM